MIKAGAIKYSGFTVDQMLTFIESKGWAITLETMREFEGEESWRIILLLGEERRVCKAGTLFGVTMEAFKPFSKQAAQERKESQERFFNALPGAKPLNNF